MRVVNTATLPEGSVSGLDGSASGFDFGVREARGGWDRRPLTTPFTDSDHLGVPGPGSYFDEGSLAHPKPVSPPNLRVVKGKLQAVETVTAPFATSSTRRCVCGVSFV